MNINDRMPGVTHRRRRVSDGITVGLYTWQMPDGKILGDGDGNVLSVASRLGDISKMNAIRAYVYHELGIKQGSPHFLEGAVKLTEGENDEQIAQMINGEVPMYDLGSLKDDIQRDRRR